MRKQLILFAILICSLSTFAQVKLPKTIKKNPVTSQTTQGETKLKFQTDSIVVRFDKKFDTIKVRAVVFGEDNIMGYIDCHQVKLYLIFGPNDYKEQESLLFLDKKLQPLSLKREDIFSVSSYNWK